VVEADLGRSSAEAVTSHPRGFEFRHSGRGEPHPLPPDERDIEDALARRQRVDEAIRNRPTWRARLARWFGRA
jgi:hypothetical protein